MPDDKVEPIHEGQTADLCYMCDNTVYRPARFCSDTCEFNWIKFQRSQQRRQTRSMSRGGY